MSQPLNQHTKLSRLTLLTSWPRCDNLHKPRQKHLETFTECYQDTGRGPGSAACPTVVGIGVGKPWAVSDHNRCEQQQSLAATKVAEAPVCQTSTTCKQRQASRYRTASKQARQGKEDQPVDTLPVQGASANDWRARYSSLSILQQNRCGLEVCKYQSRGKFAGFVLMAPKAMSRAFSAQLDRSALVGAFWSSIRFKFSYEG